MSNEEIDQQIFEARQRVHSHITLSCAKAEYKIEKRIQEFARTIHWRGFLFDIYYKLKIYKLEL